MSRNALVAVISGAVLVVALLAALTPTVIVGGGDHEGRSVRISMATPAPFPFFRRGRLPDVRRCFRSHGFGRATPPPPGELRRALRDCAPRLR